MVPLRSALRAFLRRDEGAVTVEYVVLAAAVTGVALASSDVITNGLGILSGTIESELSGEPPAERAALTYDDGFDNGAAGWTGAAATDIRGFGNVLGPIGGSGGAPSLTRDFRIDPAAGAATFAFDVLAIDSLDGESGIIFIDGVEVGRVTSDHGRTTITTAAELEARGITFAAEVVDDDTDLGGAQTRPDWRDSRTRVTISMAQPGETVRFGFGSNADQGVNDEAFALDNFRATGLADPDATR